MKKNIVPLSPDASKEEILQAWQEGWLYVTAETYEKLKRVCRIKDE